MLARIRRRFLFSRGFRRFVRGARRVVLPGFEGFSLYEVARVFFRALRDGNLVLRASAISFKLFVAFFPALIVVITLLSFIPFLEPDGQLLEALSEVLPPRVHEFLVKTIEDLGSRPRGTLLSFSFLGAIYLASNSINAILRGFRASSNVSTWHSAWKERLWSIGVLIAVILTMAIAVPVLTASGAVIRLLDREGILTSGVQVFALQAARFGVAIALVLVAVALLYHAGQPGRRRFRLVTPGAIVAVVLIGAASQLLAFFFANVADYNVVYGSIGAILAVLLWLYVNMIVLLVGYELNAAIQHARRRRSGHLRLAGTTEELRIGAPTEAAGRLPEGL